MPTPSTKKVVAKKKVIPAKRLNNPMQKPFDLLVEIIPLPDIGKILAKQNSLPAGDYELVLEYKMGPSSLRTGKEPDQVIPGMGVAVAGMGLRKAEKHGPFTITVE